MITWQPGISLEELEKQAIIEAYAHYKNNKTATAHALGIAIRTLDHKLEKYAADAATEKENYARRKAKEQEQLLRHRGKLGFTPETGTHILGIAAGVGMESPLNAPSQSDMPVPKRQEIQNVLQESAPSSSPRRGRPPIQRPNGKT